MDQHAPRDSESLINDRLTYFKSFFSKRNNWVTTLVLAILVWFAVKLRTLNLPGLRDVSTGGWTLGPDLDPFLFLRWAKYIVAHGALFAWDTMRYVPLGYNTREELALLSYMIAWFHKIASHFGSTSVDQSAVIFPAVMFGFTVIAFFLLTRKVFIDTLGETKANIIALLSAFFLTIFPTLLPRTIAGIPEKESVGFLFLFLAFYFFLCAWKATTNTPRYVHTLLAAASTTLMALTWGGYTYIYVTLGPLVFIAFLLNQVTKEKMYLYALWLLASVGTITLFTARYTITSFLTSITTLPCFFTLGIMIIHTVILNVPQIRKYIEKQDKLSKLPLSVVSILITIILGFIAVLVAFGPGFIVGQTNAAIHTLVNPITDRIGVTVAENRQPFFPEWSASFGPMIKNIPITFWLFFIGSAHLFYFMLHKFPKKERIALTAAYVFFLIAIIFSRYKAESLFNGTNGASLFLYFLGPLVLVLTTGYYYFQARKHGTEEKFKTIDMGLLLLFMFFFLSIVSARGAVRVIMVLVPSASILISYITVILVHNAYTVKGDDDMRKMMAWILGALVLFASVYSAYQLYGASKATAQSYIPSVYTQQWQYAMSWVRDNTPTDAVFAHWWDYGYWLQSIGDRATVLDGGNAIGYWNYLMGRYALTGTDNYESLEFLYTHNTTHFLIDSSDIGKYSAFSSIGSDENYDRASWIPTFLRDTQQVQETKNSTIYLFVGGTPLDGDITYVDNGTQIFLPAQRAGIGGVLLEQNKSGALVKQPIGIYVDNNKRYDLPLRYAYYNGKLIDFGSGVSAGVFVFPRVVQAQSGFQMDAQGALLYLSNKTVRSQLARLYLYEENNPYFKISHSEDDILVKQIKSNNISTSDFVFYDQMRGPIRIWEIQYPKDIEPVPQYLEKEYPDKRLTIV